MIVTISDTCPMWLVKELFDRGSLPVHLADLRYAVVTRHTPFISQIPKRTTRKRRCRRDYGSPKFGPGGNS